MPHPNGDWRVFAQVPAAGTIAPTCLAVTTWVARPLIEGVSVPGVARPVRGARARPPRADERPARRRRVRGDPSGATAPDVVWAQSPAEGRRVAAGSAVVIAVQPRPSDAPPAAATRPPPTPRPPLAPAAPHLPHPAVRPPARAGTAAGTPRPRRTVRRARRHRPRRRRPGARGRARAAARARPATCSGTWSCGSRSTPSKPRGHGAQAGAHGHRDPDPVHDAGDPDRRGPGGARAPVRRPTAP